MADYNYLTKEGFDRLINELDDLKGRGRSEAARAIADARDKGDLAENAEYHAAKDEQAMLEFKISDLERTLSNARVLDQSQLDTSHVVLLSKVTIKNLKSHSKLTYQLVSETEADLKEKKISIGSPMGQGLLGKAVGEIAHVDTPAGKLEFEIIDIRV
ncbi:MAG TPA: transcription elongation factor GreA [Saprospiraceae bacterium]|nr:transcription elongation factor GreA [Saprospiraceae bacterium]